MAFFNGCSAGRESGFRVRRGEAGGFEEAHTRGALGRLVGLALRLQLGYAGRRVLADLIHYVELGTPSPRKQRANNTAS